MERVAELIRLLADGELHSGEALAHRLGMTRAAVWKALRQAQRRLGLDLESMHGRGYRLAAPLELLDPERILNGLSERARGSLTRLEIHQQIDSTNRHLMREAAAGAPSGTICLAERQSAGQGRRGRPWVSPFGANLYLSILWRFQVGPASLGGLSLVAGAVLADLLRRNGVRDLMLKWPNDLLWQRRKLGGILIEVSGETQGPCALVLGVGINLRMPRDQGRAIDQPWADLNDALGGLSYSRNLLAAQAIDALIEGLDDFGREGLTPYLRLWDEFDALRGERVDLQLGDRTISGVMSGIAPDGALRLVTPAGEQVFHAGEVSLRTEVMESR